MAVVVQLKLPVEQREHNPQQLWERSSGGRVVMEVLHYTQLDDIGHTTVKEFT